MKQFAIKAVAGALIAAAPMLAMADSSVTSTPAAGTSASLDFKIVVPKVLSLRVGNAAAGSVDTITFNPNMTTIGTPAAGSGPVTVTVIGNSGDVKLVSAAPTTGLQGNTPGNSTTIAYSKITPSSSDSTNLDHPAFNVAAGFTVTAVSGVVNRTATWSFSYLNDTVVPADTYGALTAGAKGGRVTYTATAP